MLKRLLALFSLALLLYAPSIFADLEGFGSDGSFGFGQTVYRVTNLNLSGAGSLADAVSGDNRFIVFETSGTINYTSGYSLVISGDNLTCRVKVSWDTIDWTNEADIKFPGNVDPVLSTGSGDRDAVAFIWDGTRYLGIANYNFE